MKAKIIALLFLFVIKTPLLVRASYNCSPTSGGTIDYSNLSAIKAQPNSGYKFSKWIVKLKAIGGSGDGNTYTYTQNPINAWNVAQCWVLDYCAATFTAYFEKITTYTLTVVSSNTTYGTVSGGGTYDYGTNHQITATPNECYRFVQWSDGNTNNPRTITVTGDATYTAEFEQIQYTIEALPDNPAQGSATVTNP